MIVDAHVHVETRADGQLCPPDELLRAMDCGGISVSVLFGNDQGDAGNRPPWAEQDIPVATRFSDEQVAAYCSAAPQRFIGVGSVHPERYRPEQKVRRAVEGLGLSGIKLYPHAGFTANDRRLYPVYEYCQSKGIPVIIHTGIKAVRWQHMKYNDPMNADDVATDFPRLPVVICHGGYPWVEAFMAVAATNDNVWVDLTFLEYLERRFLADGLTADTVRRLSAIIGSERLLWGSEGPYMNLPLYGSHGPEHYRECQDFLVNRFDFLSSADKENILGRNALRLFGRSDLTAGGQQT